MNRSRLSPATSTHSLPSQLLSCMWVQRKHNSSNLRFDTSPNYISVVPSFSPILMSICHGCSCASAEGFGQAWNEMPIPHNDTNGEAFACPNSWSLDAKGTLSLVLHYLNSTMQEVSLQQIFALVSTVLSQYLFSAMNILLQTLHTLPNVRICWFNKLSQFHVHNKLVCKRHLLILLGGI